MISINAPLWYSTLKINACRLYLQVKFLSDITNISENYIMQGVLIGNKINELMSKYKCLITEIKKTI